MATTAQGIPALEVSAPDDNMDVLSDTAFDFGDGDLDLDLDTAPSIHDEDMSLNDSATDGGIEMSEHFDQDDVMALHGYLVEEDDVYSDGSPATPQTVDEDVAIVEADMLAPPDEDLIDYSDDEAQQPLEMHSPSVHEEQDVHVSIDLEMTAAQVDDLVEDVQTQQDEQPSESSTGVNEETQAQDDDVAKNFETAEPRAEHEIGDAVPQHEGSDEGHADDEGGVALPIDEDSRYNQIAVEPQEQQEEVEKAEEDHESVHHNDQQIELQPVTINYAGNELWLFKQHDLDHSGDFLLDGLSIAKSSVSDLFQACRLSLGDDVSSEHEIGFRFDHLHNLELYEDNTACVAVSLERMVDLYHTLQAQDGNENPESFYITLQFRPRFATLLADIAQYADQGSGYSALDAAVSAGETHFSNVFSSASTEHDQVEWDEEENEEADASSPVSVHSIAQEGVEADESEEQEEVQVETSSQGNTQPQDTVALQQESEDAQDAQGTKSRVAQEAVSLENLEEATTLGTAEQIDSGHELQLGAASERDVSEPQDERTPDQIAHDKQEAEDFVDYSDDEDEQDDKQEASPSSSTVQGDDLTNVQEHGAAEQEEHDDADLAEAELEQHDDDTTLLTQTQYDDDANHYAFQDYTESFEQGDPFQEYQADGTVGDAFEAHGNFTGGTNQDFADYNFQEMDGDINLGFEEQPVDNTNHGDYGDEAHEAVEDVTHTDAFLDLDNAPEWAVDADPNPNLPGEDAVLLHDNTAAQEDEEGGAVEQPGATKSSAADLALTSSHDHSVSSPQGQKRSIDEVSNGIDDVPDSTDAKRARV